MNNETNPSYYQSGDMQLWDVVDSWGLGYHLGNILKYVCRAGKKETTNLRLDLSKAIRYGEHAIDLLMGSSNPIFLRLRPHSEAIDVNLVIDAWQLEKNLAVVASTIRYFPPTNVANQLRSMQTIIIALTEACDAR